MDLSNEIDLSVEQIPQNPIVLQAGDGDYNSLVNKPQINGVGLVGNKTSDELHLASSEQGEKADTALQSGDNISELYNNSDYQNGTQVASSISDHNTSNTAHSDIRTALSDHTSNTSNPHSVTATQVGLGNCDNTSDLNKPISTATQTALDGKQATLVSGTNIKTVNGNSLLGSGNVNVDALPSQTGQSGKFLTTDGTDASWANVDALPSQTGQNGKFLTTNGSAASWAAVDALPSQTGNQGKFLTTDGSSASWGVPMAGFPLFYHTFQDHILNNSSWLRSDTNSWQSGSVYTSAYAHLVADISGITSETETVAGTTITFYRADDGHKIVLPDQESNVSAIYAATGMAWYYILDTTNTRFKLPRSSHGNIVEKYQNGTLWYRVYSDGWCEQGGTITGDYVQVNLSKPYANANYNIQVTMDSSYESSVSFAAIGVRGSVTTSYFELWGGSTIGYKFWKTSGYISNPPENAQYKYLYFYVGNTIQNETSVDVAELAEDLNGKTDIDLGNLSNTGKSTSAHLAMPSDTYDDLTLGASGNTYTMPSDGYLCLFMNMTGSYSNMAILNAATGRSQYQYAGGSIGLAITMAVHKSEVMTVYYGAAGSATKEYFRFYYAEGSKTLA